MRIDTCSETFKIIQLCRSMDIIAHQSFSIFSQDALAESLKKFWTEMAKEEQDHVTFWNMLLGKSKLSGLPEIFENGPKVIKELEKILGDSEDLLKKVKASPSISECFLIAYQLESHMLHPAFVLLFDNYSEHLGNKNLNDDYDEHINHFANGIAEFGQGAPELKPLGQMLRQLWLSIRKYAADSVYDSVTGLFNRRGFHQIALNIISLASRQKNCVAILLVDLDGFKLLNDQKGHLAGDQLLREVGKCLKSSLRSCDVVARYGGDEFIILLSAISNDKANLVAERICTSIADEFGQGETPITASIGVADSLIEPKAEDAIKDLIEKADQSLYAAKRTGKNRVCTFPKKLS